MIGAIASSNPTQQKNQNGSLFIALLFTDLIPKAQTSLKVAECQLPLEGYEAKLQIIYSQNKSPQGFHLEA